MNDSIIDSKDALEQPTENPRKTNEKSFRVHMLGGTGVGKTCFIAGLALLNRQSNRESFVLVKNECSQTKQVFNSLRKMLESGRWPGKTSILDNLQFVIKKGSKRADIELADFSGESFTDAMQRGDDTTAALQVQRLVKESDMLLLLLDGSLVDRGEKFHGQSQIQAIFERMEYESFNDLEIAVILTKSDLCQLRPVRTGKDLEELVQERAPDIYNFLSDHPKIKTHWIPLSVCGPEGLGPNGEPIYEKLSPQGYQAFFDVLLSRNKREFIKRFYYASLVLALSMLLMLGWWQLRERQITLEKDQINNLNFLVRDLPEKVHPRNEPFLIKRYEDEFRKIKEKIEQASSIESLQLESDKLSKIPKQHQELVHDNLDSLKNFANRRKELLLFEVVIAAREIGTLELINASSAYLSEFPKGQNSDQVNLWLAEIKELEYASDRARVRSIAVTSATQLAYKKEEIRKFLEKHRQKLVEDELQAISEALGIAADLLISRNYSCKLVRTTLDKPRNHSVEINLNGEKIAYFGDSGSVREKSWNKDIELSWKSGQTIKITLLGSGKQEMAYFQDDTPISIVLLAKSSVPSGYKSVSSYWFWSEDFPETRPPFEIKFTCKELSIDRLKVISDYIHPGTKW
jgi:hypothetical protein